MKKFFFVLFVTLAPLLYAEAPQIYFSPQDHIADRLTVLIEKERKSIYVAVYCLTHRGIAQALVDAKLRGVRVEVVVDPFSIKAAAPLERLTDVGIPVYVWAPETKKKRKPLMHHKFCLFGDSVLWTGSFNLTYEANRSNQENVLVIDAPDVVKKYKEQFDALKSGPSMPYKEYLITHPKTKKTG